MGNELDFESIEKVFARRPKKDEASITVSRDVPLYRTTLYSEPRYECMHAKNINVTKTGLKHAKNDNLKLKTGVALGFSVVAVALAIAVGSTIVPRENNRPVTNEPPGITISDTDVQETPTITLADCDLDNFTVIFKEGSDNVGSILDSAIDELSDYGVATRSVGSDVDMLVTIEDIKNSNPNMQILVINVDGSFNKTDINVIMTNFNNKMRSADNLSLAIKEEGYNMHMDIRCGKKGTGDRIATSVESTLASAKIDDVACLTIAPTTTYLGQESNENIVAKAIVKGAIRWSSLSNEERYKDTIRCVDYGDTLSGLAASNGVSQDFIKKANEGRVDVDHLAYGQALIVGEIPVNLTSEVNMDLSKSMGK